MREQHGPIFSPVASRASAMRARTTAESIENQDTMEVDIEDDDSYYVQPRPHTSVRTYVQPGQVRARPKVQVHPGQHISVPPTRNAPRTNAPAAPATRRKGFFRRPKHPLLWLGVGMVLMLALWTLFTMGLSWWSVTQDDIHYGRPRTAQYDVVIGHNDSTTHKTHIVVINLNAHIIIIELPGGDVSKSVIYNGPTLYGQDADLAPITLTFQDRTGNGKLDMVVHFQGSEIIYLNQNGKFVPQQSQ